MLTIIIMSPSVYNVTFLFQKFKNKIERIQYRVLQFLHNDYDFDNNTFLKKSGKCSVEVQRL